MNADHKRAISRGVSRFMEGLAKERQCPSCQRKAALGRRLYDFDAGYSWAKCRYCGYEDTREW